MDQDPKVLSIRKEEEILDFGDKLREEISGWSPNVGDFSLHPINGKIAKLSVRSMEVKWRKPPDWGVRTQFKVESMADRRMVRDKLQGYVYRGYLMMSQMMTYTFIYYFFSENQMVPFGLLMISDA